MVSSQGKITLLARGKVGLLGEKENSLSLSLAMTTPPTGLFGIQPGRREACIEGERRFHGQPNHGGEALAAHPNPSRREVWVKHGEWPSGAYLQGRSILLPCAMKTGLIWRSNSTAVIAKSLS